MKPIIKAYMTVYRSSEDDAWTAYESMSPAQYHEIMRMYNGGYTAQQPTETENAPQAATQAVEGTAQQANPITAAIIDGMTAPAPAQTITATLIGPDGTPYRATYSADLLDSLRTEARVLDIQDDTTGELVYIKP